MNKHRQVFKYIYNFFSIVAAFPFVFFYYLFGFLYLKDPVFREFSQFLSVFPCFFGKMIRRGFYFVVLSKCSNSLDIDYGSFFSSLNVSIGDNVYIGSYSILSSCDIGNDVLIGSGVYIANKNAHSFDEKTKLIRKQECVKKIITIGNDCWIGNAVVIMGDIGSHCVVGAGTVVVDKIDPCSVVVGNPARVVKQR